MMRRIKYMLVSIFALTIALTSGCANNKPTKWNTNTISGTILFKDPQIDYDPCVSGSRLFFFDPWTTKLTPVGIDGTNARFAGASNKIITSSDKDTLSLFDITTGEERAVYKTKNEGDLIYDYSIAFADENHISVVLNDKSLLLVDIRNSTEKVIAENIGNPIHSWSNSGRTVYFSKSEVANNNVKNKIMSKDADTGEEKYICDGIAPRVSRNGNILVYSTTGLDGKMIVRNLTSGKEWRYATSANFYCPSPDGRYVVLLEPWHGAWFYDGYTVNVWDYEKNISQTVLPRYANGQCCDIDWID